VAKAIVGCKIWFPQGSVGSSPTTRTNQPRRAKPWPDPQRESQSLRQPMGASGHLKRAVRRRARRAPCGQRQIGFTPDPSAEGHPPSVTGPFPQMETRDPSTVEPAPPGCPCRAACRCGPPRPRPGRTGLRQAQNPAAQSRPADHRANGASDRRPPRHLRAPRMRQRPPQFRMRFGSLSLFGKLVAGTGFEPVTFRL
jgi:hypothetical protein